MSEGTWLQCTIEGDTLGARYGCAGCRVEERWYMFGGASMDDNGINHYYGDLFLLTLNGSKIYSSKISTSGVDPGPRVGGFLMECGGFLYLYGGTCNEFTLQHVRGLYKLDTSSFTWYEVELQDDPGPVSQSISVKNNTVYMFGGVVLDEPSNNLYTLNLRCSPLKWASVETKGAVPHPRVDHCSVVSDNKLFVFGGSGSHVLWFNDLHCLDLTTLTWTKIKVSSGVYPSPCDFSTVSYYDNNYLLLFGGSNDSLPEHDFNEVWYYSLSTNSWYTCETMGDKPHTRHVHVTTLYDDLMYVFGGLGNTTLYDCWVLQIHSLKGRKIPVCQIENPSPPTTLFKIQEELPPVPPLTDFQIPDIEKHTGLEKLKESVLGQISKGFSVLEAEYAALYGAKERFELEKLQLAQSRDSQEKWIVEQRDDLIRQCNEHTQLCKDWAALQTEQFGKERAILLDERKRLERAQRRLAADQDTFNKRVKKLEELMNRTKMK
ncbi:hypothetical protein ACHWQZ_G014631 [Mnemiopsis leidyi]